MFIKEKRSNEVHFEQIYEKLNKEYTYGEKNVIDDAYYKAIAEVKEKYAEEYTTSKEKTGNAWPEFEKFVSSFEKAVTKALNERDTLQ